MKRLVIAVIWAVVLSLTAVMAEDASQTVPLRRANGTLIEGVVQEATKEGIVVQTSKGSQTIPWKYLSIGSRFRYQRPLEKQLKPKK